MFLLRKVIPLDDHPFSDLCYPLNPQPSYLLGAKLKNSATRFQIIPLCNVPNAKTLKVSLYFHLLTTSYILHSVFHAKRNETKQKKKKRKEPENLVKKSGGKGKVARFKTMSGINFTRENLPTELLQRRTRKNSMFIEI